MEHNSNHLLSFYLCVRPPPVYGEGEEGEGSFSVAVSVSVRLSVIMSVTLP